MKILSLLKRGINHANFNEDFLYTHYLNKEIVVCAVMDGCSSATNSHFVASLFSKSLHKSCRMLPQMKEIREDFDLKTMELEAIGDFMMSHLYNDLKKIKKLFFLKTEELLSTIVLAVYNKKERVLNIQMSGDGIFVINKKITEIDQNNVPNFLGYHLNSNFESIRENEVQRWNFSEVKEFSISTDGIDKFRKDFANIKDIIEVRNAFFIDEPNEKEKEFLEVQFNSFVNNGFTPFDDIGIIRIVNNY